MSSLHSASEESALSELERKLKTEGYRVVRDPEPSSLPPFLRKFRPDAIATGRSPSLFIEIVEAQPWQRLTDLELEQLQALLTKHADWSLRVIVSPPRSKLPSVASRAEIEQRLLQVRKVGQYDVQAALASAWALLEAVTRMIDLERAARPLTPASTVEFLASLGLITETDADFLREIASLRNLVVHGDLSVTVTEQQLAELLQIIQNVLSNPAEPDNSELN